MDSLIKKLHEDAVKILEVQSRPSALYKPLLYRDEGHWCALYGQNLQEGIAGFGVTQEEALVDFDKQWCNPPRVYKSIIKYDRNAHHIAPGEYSVDDNGVATWTHRTGYAAISHWFEVMGVTGGQLSIKGRSGGIPIYSNKYSYKNESFEVSSRDGLLEVVGGQEVVSDLRSAFFRYFHRVQGLAE